MFPRFPFKYLILFLVLFPVASICHSQIDTLIGRHAPGAQSHKAEQLAQYLCRDLTTDRQKANAIYNWITHNIRYDVKSAMNGKLKHDNVKRVLYKRKGVCEGYAYLFRDMCQAVGLQAVTVEGYARDWIFDNGDKLYVPRHEWNAVLIDGQWQLVDATWGAGGIAQSPGWIRRQLNKISKNPVQTGKLRFVYNYDTSFFLPDPEEFRLAHLPTDPIWQLTDTAMPVSIFEAGEAAARQFNAISNPSQEKYLLGAAADYNELIRTYDYAERAYAFNQRYFVPMAMKEQVDAEIEIQFGDSLNKVDPMPARYRYGKASRALAMSKEYLKQQNEGYSLEARELKQKNHRKNDSTKRYIRLIKTDNKRLLAKCELKKKSSASKLRQISEKESALRRLASDKELKPKQKKSATTPGAAAIAIALDSANSREQTLADLANETGIVEAKLQAALGAGKARLDTLARALLLSDSLLVQETIAHLQMHDVYDEDVITYSSAFKSAKFGEADTMHDRYQRGYDSIQQYYSERSKLEYARMNLYKSSLRALAKYQQPGVSQAAQTRYNALLGHFNSDVASYGTHLQEYKQYVRNNAAILEELAKLYKRQEKITGYMARAEEKRNAQEQRLLEKKASFNKQENKNQQAFVEKSMKRAKKLAG